MQGQRDRSGGARSPRDESDAPAGGDADVDTAADEPRVLAPILALRLDEPDAAEGEGEEDTEDDADDDESEAEPDVEPEPADDDAPPDLDVDVAAPVEVDDKVEDEDEDEDPAAELGTASAEPDATPVESAPVERPGRRLTWRRIAGAAVVALLLGVAVTVATRAWSSTREATERTRSTLADTRADIRRTESDLATATGERRAAQATLGDQVAALAARRDERDAAQADLDVVTLILAQAQAQLTASQVDLIEGAVRLDAFDRCLVGVAKALNQAAVGDTGGLAATIRGIEGDCAQAGVAL